MDKRLDEFCGMLSNTGMFDELEVKVLKALLVIRNSKKVKSTASEISKTANISVTNAYKYLYSLQAKGLVESNKDKNKVFWLSNTSNPFPRLQSFLAKEYLRKKEMFEKAKGIYENFVPSNGHVWLGEKIHEKYENDFEQKAAFLMDAAHEEILITADKMPEDIVLLEAIKRAAARDIKIRIVVKQIDPVRAEKLRSIGIDLRLGRIASKMFLVDGSNGIIQSSANAGEWFMNQNNSYKQQFEKYWGEAESL